MDLQWDRFFKELWKLRIPIKIKCFNLLLLMNKISSWDNLCKRGSIGPSLCPLCKVDGESFVHLFVECIFGKDVRNSVDEALAIDFVWENKSIKENIYTWFIFGISPCYISFFATGLYRLLEIIVFFLVLNLQFRELLLNAWHF